ncbi:MAG: hypothetical protein Ct9H300mP14_11450 [Gammaproteobacteria bacterium]|nr:MAG: hypothetical protein Ct9H300mP14_11450 [Gammaproteobacteria bacterium]
MQTELCAAGRFLQMRNGCLLIRKQPVRLHRGRVASPLLKVHVGDDRRQQGGATDDRGELAET